MTITEQTAAWEAYQGAAELPAEFEAVWRGRWAGAAPAGEVRVERVPFQNARATYETWTIPAPGGGELRARYIRPAGEGRFPTVLMYHDLGRGVRGWHHMTRFVALGYAVAALENRTSAADWRRDWAALDLEGRYRDVLTLAHAAMGRPATDPERLLTWGEGFGGGLALVAAALVPGVVRCGALHPLPGDLRAECVGEEADGAALDGLDLIHFASLLTCPLLLGTGLLDQMASPQSQYAIFNRARGPKTHLVYPKYEHERINFFENELLKFFHI